MEVVGRLMKVSGVERLVNSCECGVSGLGVVLEKLKNKRRRETGEKVAGRFAYGGTGGARGLTRGLVVVTDYT